MNKIDWNGEIATYWENLGFNYDETLEWLKAGWKEDDFYTAYEWKEAGFKAEESRNWIKMGVIEWEEDLAAYLRDIDYKPEDIKSEEHLKDLRNEYIYYRDHLTRKQKEKWFSKRKLENK